MTATIDHQLRRARVGFVSQGDPLNPNTFSGTARHAFEALRSIGHEVVPINSEASTRWELREARLHRLMGGRQADWLTLARISAQSRRVRVQLDSTPLDLLVTTGTTHLAFVKRSLPFVVWNDAVFPSLLDYYESFTGLSPTFKAIGRWADSSVSRRAFHCAYSSAWAAEEAKRHYKTPPECVSIVPYGPCLERIPARASALAAPRKTKPLELLFVGKEWERKGGPTAVTLATMLRQHGIETVLHIVGCNVPALTAALPFVRVHGFIMKASAAGAEQMDALFQNSHFLVVPSHAECCAQVYLEAAAFGLPVIARNTGGTSTAVLHKETGYLLQPRDENLEDAARWMMNQLTNPSAYASCRQRGRDLYESSLNWASAADKMANILRRALSSTHLRTKHPPAKEKVVAK